MSESITIIQYDNGWCVEYNYRNGPTKVFVDFKEMLTFVSNDLASKYSGELPKKVTLEPKLGEVK